MTPERRDLLRKALATYVDMGAYIPPCQVFGVVSPHPFAVVEAVCVRPKHHFFEPHVDPKGFAWFAPEQQQLGFHGDR